MAEQLKNPYENEDGFPCEVGIAPKWCLVISILFFVCISIPPIWRTLAEFSKPAEERWIPIVEIANTDSVEAANVLNEKRRLSSGVTRTEPSIRDHLQAFEKGVKAADFRIASRRVDQARQLLWLRDGNSKVFLGRNGWLYYQPEIDALTGYGPLRPEPDSVTKDPDRAEWNQPAEVILHFAEQLKERGVALTLVPVPTKPMVQPEGITGRVGSFVHPDYVKMLSRFEGSGISVVDLVPTFRGKIVGDVFLKQDTHWTVEAMQLAAKEVAAAISGSTGGTGLKVRMEPVIRESRGDLVEMMRLPDEVDFFGKESQRLQRVIDASTDEPVANDPESSIVVIGDSFVNIYEDPSIGFGTEGDTSIIGAGFASHLAAELKRKVHVIAINGEGATGVRRTFAALPDNRVRAKRSVIWVLSARDLLFSETSGLRAGVYWRDVEFNPEREEPVSDPPSSGESIRITATLTEKSAIQNPKLTPYADAVYSAIFQVDSVEEGSYSGEEASVFLWAFRDRKMEPTAEVEVGKQYRLSISPIENLPEVKTRTRLDDLFRIDLDPMFASEVEEISSPR